MGLGFVARVGLLLVLAGGCAGQQRPDERLMFCCEEDNDLYRALGGDYRREDTPALKPGASHACLAFSKRPIAACTAKRAISTSIRGGRWPAR